MCILLRSCFLLLTAAQVHAVDVISVGYDSADERISLQAHRASLKQILATLDHETSLSVRTLRAESYGDEITLSLDNVPLEQGLHSLLRDFGWVLLRPSEGDYDTAATVIVLSRNNPSGARRSAQSETPARDNGLNDLTGYSIDGPGDLAEALMRDRRLLSKLKALPEDDQMQIAAGLLDAMQNRRFASFGGAMKVLGAAHALAPEKTNAAMADWLESDDQHLRMIAATGLARFAGESAVPLLSAALLGEDVPTRQVAANGLARIGGAEATSLLVSQYASGNRSLQLMAVSAVANHGNAAAQTAIAEQILQTALPENLTPKTVIDDYLAQAEEAM